LIPDSVTKSCWLGENNNDLRVVFSEKGWGIQYYLEYEAYSLTIDLQYLPNAFTIFLEKFSGWIPCGVGGKPGGRADSWTNSSSRASFQYGGKTLVDLFSPMCFMNR